MPNPLTPTEYQVTALPRIPTPEKPAAPTAEEAALASQLLARSIRQSRLTSGWTIVPEITTSGDRSLSIGAGQVLSVSHPQYVVNTSVATIDIPALVGSGTVDRRDRLSLVVVQVKEEGRHNANLLWDAGNLPPFLIPQTDGSIATVDFEGENYVRQSALLLWVVSPDPVTGLDFIQALPEGADGERLLTVVAKGSTGFGVGTFQVYAFDSAIATNEAYEVYTDTVEILPLCDIRRHQNYRDRGYIYGNSGEDPFDRNLHIAITAKRDRVDPISRLREIIAGKPGRGSTFRRAILNLFAGTSASSPNRPGEISSAPNGSTNLANDRRTFFSNEPRMDKYYARVVTTGNDGSGNATISVDMGSAPAGTIFSPTKSNHKVFAPDGSEQGDLGVWLNLGGTGSLTWVAGPNATIVPGQVVYIQPGILYPSGSGISTPFYKVDGVWLGGIKIDPADIRDGASEDLDAYTNPSGGTYFVVWNRERSALQYILKKIELVADADGVLAIPETEYGSFAWIEGVADRIDAPIATGLTPSSGYNALVYYPPRIGEQWQIDVIYPEYQGLKDNSILDGAIIDSEPLGYLHSQGGGLSVFGGDSTLSLIPISRHLPSLENSQILDYNLNTPVYLSGESSSEIVTFRNHFFLPGSNAVFPSPGQRIVFAEGNASHQKSVNGSLQISSGFPIGYQCPSLNSDLSYQSVFAFCIRKNNQIYLVVSTHNGKSETVLIDSDRETAFDVFEI